MSLYYGGVIIAQVMTGEGYTGQVPAYTYLVNPEV